MKGLSNEELRKTLDEAEPLKPLKCPGCGAVLELCGDGFMKCTGCGRKFGKPDPLEELKEPKEFALNGDVIRCPGDLKKRKEGF